MKKSLSMILTAAVVLGLLGGLSQPAAAAAATLDFAPGQNTVTGVIEIRAAVDPLAVDRYAITAQMGRPGDYPTQQTLVSLKVKDDGPAVRYQWETYKFTDGYWTIRLITYAPGDLKGVEAAVRTITVDNRFGVPDTEPGAASGAITVVPSATGTVAVKVKVDPNAVEWTLSKQNATDLGTNRWTKMYGNGLREDTYHWYTRNEVNGVYTLRLEVKDSIYHRRFVTTTVTVDNRFGLPQTEPGTASGTLDVPAIISGQLPFDMAFTGTVSAWRLLFVGPGQSPTNGTIASGTGGARQTVAWDTTKRQDGTYLVLLEVEDEHRHISQVTANTTVANKVTTTLKQTIEPQEEHQYIVSVAGGLTAFKLSSNPAGYYQLSVKELQGRQLGSVRVNPNSLPLGLDLPGGKYVVSVKSLFTEPKSEYTVEMTGATAYTIPLAKITTNLPLSMRLTASVPALMAQGTSRPSAADWSVDGGAPTAITKPDGTVDIDTRPLPEGLHMLTFRAANPVGFTVLANFPFVVDNQPSFSDVPDMDPAHWAVELLHDLNASRGYPDGTFKPAGQVTRAELAKLLAVVTGLDTTRPYSNTFADVKPGDWFAPYVEAVYQAGVVKGSAGPNNTTVFRPGDPVSRAELMVMVLRALDVPEMLNANATKTLSNPDWRTVPDWAKPSVYIGMKTGLLSQREGLRVDADKPALRGEVAIALARLSLNGSRPTP